MAYRAYTGHAELDLENLRAFAICERCGQIHNHDRLSWQTDFRGPGLQNLRILVCPGCLDIPNPTSKTIVLPPDPIPILNPRPDNGSTFDFTASSTSCNSANMAITADYSQSSVIPASADSTLWYADSTKLTANLTLTAP